MDVARDGSVDGDRFRVRVRDGTMDGLRVMVRAWLGLELLVWLRLGSELGLGLGLGIW